MNKTKELFSLTGTTALITGSYRGLGFSMARGMAEAGAHVVLNGRSPEGVDRAVAEFKQAGLSASASVFDITNEDAVSEAVSEITREFGKIDILVNNAGVQRRHLLKDMPLADFEYVLQTNLTAAFTVTKVVVQDMLKRKSGKIINICSLMSELARPTTGNYCAAKGGLQMLTRAMAGEWASDNIQINGIGPGYFATDMTEPLRKNPEFNDWICRRTPAGRWGTPEELQGLVIFLASKASSFVNGQVIFVDGGLTAVI